jgi:transcription elongation factor GreB
MKMKALALNYINAKLQLLNNRIATAKIVDSTTNQMMKYDLVRWLLKIIGKTELQQYQIVGVDEADISKRENLVHFANCQNIDKQKSGETDINISNENRVLKLWR